LELFGFEFKRKKAEDGTKNQSFAVPQTDDGTATIQTSGASGGLFASVVDMEGSVKTEADLIKRYRDIASYPDCDMAIEDIVSESIAAQDDEKVVTLNQDDVKLSDSIKKKISEEFDEVLQLLDFNTRGHDIYRRWYIDGRLYYHKIVDINAPKRGITELRYIDPRKIKKVREVKKEIGRNGVQIVKDIEEYFVFSERGITPGTAGNPNLQTADFSTKGIKLSTDSITYVTSGLIDLDRNVVLSYLHKAIKPVNQLRMMEDALVIYRMSRAPERRIFYIDTGRLPPQKAEQYVKDIMVRYRNKIVYDAQTGEVRDDRKYMSMLEDFWMPRSEGGKGTEIDTLPGAENLSQIDDIIYFQKKLYQSLNVPITRLNPDQSMQIFGRASEVSRDELKFSKFISRLRKRFSELFSDLLKTNLILKGVITEEDWADIESKLRYNFMQDEYYSEIKETEILRNRIDMLNQIQPYVGVFFSQEYVQKKVLRMSDEDIEETKEQIAEEEPLVLPGQEPATEPGQDQEQGQVDQEPMGTERPAPKP
jgi:hypothetical protein